MNTWQVCKQLKFLLLARKWENNPAGEFVFNQQGVVVTVGPTDHAFQSMIPPFALLKPGSALSDPSYDEAPDLIQQALAILIGVVIPGDPYGESALMGSNRQGQTDSRGRGLLELEEEVYAAIELLNQIEGVEIQSRAKSEAGAEMIDETRYSAFRELDFEIITSTTRSYPPVRNFTATDATGGDADLSLYLPPTRYDTRNIKILRVSGSTPTTDPTDAGAEVVVDAAAGSDPYTLTDSPTAGVWSYSAFATYDEWGSGTNERFSPPETATVTVT